MFVSEFPMVLQFKLDPWKYDVDVSSLTQLPRRTVGGEFMRNDLCVVATCWSAALFCGLGSGHVPDDVCNAATRRIVGDSCA